LLIPTTCVPELLSALNIELVPSPLKCNEALDIEILLVQH